MGREYLVIAWTRQPCLRSLTEQPNTSRETKSTARRVYNFANAPPERRANRTGIVMRIIAGERRGHRLEMPAKRTTRPTSDLVRESIFNIVGELVADRIVVDLFAGTGALGLEALSRGASSALFVEQDRGNIAVIRKNIGHLRYEDRSRVLHGDAFRWLSSAAVPGTTPSIVFLDPPYDDYARRAKRIHAGLGALVSTLAPESLIVVELPERFERALLPGENWDIRRYGSTKVGFCLVEARAPVEAGNDALVIDVAP